MSGCVGVDGTVLRSFHQLLNGADGLPAEAPEQFQVPGVQYWWYWVITFPHDEPPMPL